MWEYTGGNEQLKALRATSISPTQVDVAVAATPPLAGPSSPRRRATYDAVPESSGAAAKDATFDPPPVKRARTENDVAKEIVVNTSVTSVTSTSATKITTVTPVNSKKGKGRAKKPLPEPWTCKDFKTRFPHPAAFVVYLNKPADERHPVNFHKDAPLDGVRAFFISFAKGLSISMAVNMNHLFRLGGLVQDTFCSPFGHSGHSKPSPEGHTTHVIVYSEGSGPKMKFKDVMKALAIAEEAHLVGQEVADGVHSTKRDVWVITSDWLVDSVKQADQQRSTGQKAEKKNEMGYLVECEGDKKRRKTFTLRRQSTASIVVDPPLDMDDFHMPESQLST